MKASNAQAIQRSFTKQSASFETKEMSFSKEEYLQWAVERIAPQGQDRVLEVAAGTCVLGRAMARGAAQVTCLDLTAAMLEVGKQKAAEQGLDNMEFVMGDAQELPYPEDHFDGVVTRLALHHFPDPSQPFMEMARVLKPGGKLAVIVMEAGEGTLRDVRDEIERMRDPSHVHTLSAGEVRGLFQKNGIPIIQEEQRAIPVALHAWMQLTDTPAPIREEIACGMLAEIDGGEKTGFSPYYKGEAIYFDQIWTLWMGQKPGR